MLFSCKEKRDIYYQEYIDQQYLEKICERIPEDWNAGNDVTQLYILPNDSIKIEKIPFPPGFLENIVTEKHLQTLLKDNLIDSKDIDYFFHSKNKEYKLYLHDLKIDCENKLFKYVDGRDTNTCFYSQPFYTKDRKVFIFKEIKFFPTITEINLICINNRIGKTKTINMLSKIYRKDFR